MMLLPNGIRAILFDLDGTLRHSQPSGAAVFTEYVAGRGYPISADDRQRALRWEHYYWANSPELAADVGADKNEDQQFWCKYSYRRLVALGLSVAAAESLAPQVCQHMEASYRPEHVTPTELLGVLAALRQAGYRLGVVSNRDHPFGELLQEMGLCPFFDFSLAGGEVKSWKPEPGIFHAALERADSTAAQTLYVGDNYFADVIGARRAGLRPVLYDPGGLFHEPGCPVITSFDGLIEVIRQG
ncbi:MAG: HAD family hydrolase [Chloroflexota bacterium]